MWFKPWPLWLSSWSVSLQTRDSWVWFPLGAHTKKKKKSSSSTSKKFLRSICVHSSQLQWRKSELKASALTHLSRIWLITLHVLMHPVRMEENEHRIIGYECSCELHQSFVYTMPRKSSSYSKWLYIDKA